MPLTLQEVQQAVVEAEATIRRADSNIETMIELVSGKLRLKYTDNDYRYRRNLAKLKKQLENFDCRTRQWKD
jgi:hypothetical protein